MASGQAPPPPWLNWLLLAILALTGVSNLGDWQGSATDWLFLVVWLLFGAVVVRSFVVQLRSRRRSGRHAS